MLRILEIRFLDFSKWLLTLSKCHIEQHIHCCCACSLYITVKLMIISCWLLWINLRGSENVHSYNISNGFDVGVGLKMPFNTWKMAIIHCVVWFENALLSHRNRHEIITETKIWIIKSYQVNCGNWNGNDTSWFT